MHEYIRSIFRCNKPKTFLVIETFYCSFCHYSLPPFFKIIVNNGRKQKTVRRILFYLTAKDFYSLIYYSTGFNYKLLAFVCQVNSHMAASISNQPLPASA